MTSGTLHVVFRPSGAGSLRQALEDAGRDDQVVSAFDDLSFGPINPPDLPLRSKWVENELGWTGWDGLARDSEAFWREALSRGPRKVAWLSRRSAMEYAGFLEWLWRTGDAPCEVVDLSEVMISHHPGHDLPRPPVLAVSLGTLNPDAIGRDKLWDLAKPLRQATRGQYRELWQQLRTENAPLRVTDGAKLVSAPISTFDRRLMSYATNDWQKTARIVGMTLSSQMDDDLIQAGDMFLAARIDAIVESGGLEIQGKSALEIHNSLVRLPQ